MVEAEVFFAAAPEVFADFETARLEAVLRPPGFLDRALAIALSLCQRDPDVPTLRLFVGVVVSPRLLWAVLCPVPLCNTLMATDRFRLVSVAR